MELLSDEEFLQTKSSNTMVVLGSGSSINLINQSGWDHISRFDSIGFNWFCHHSFGPNYFLLREQASNFKRNRDTETTENLYKDLSKHSYSKTVIIISDISKNASKTYYSVKKHKANIKQKGIIKRDLKGQYRINRLKQNLFAKGIFHGRCTLTNVLHVILSMKYERIIFAGIDLNNCKYFWLPPNKTRKCFQGVKNIHPIAKKTIPLIRDMKSHFGIQMISISPKSMINKIIPYKSIEEIK
jgi:hypothetical protein